MNRDIAELGTILSVWAHPDDESYLAGGVMALARAQGQRVVCVSATAGEHGTDDPASWPPDRLGRLRRWEAAAAMAVLGVREHRWLGFEDGSLAATDPEAGIARVAEVIEEVTPDTILTFGPDGRTFHPDHITIGRWVTEARRRHAPTTRLLHAALEVEQHARFRDRLETWGVYMTDERPVPVAATDTALLLELSDEVLDQKVAALAAMHSQTAGAIDLLTPAEYRELNRVEAFVEA